MRIAVNRVFCVVVLAFLALLPRSVRGAPGDVKASFDAPCKYPAGMATDGKSLFVVDWREAKIFQVNPANAGVTKSWDAPTLKPSGLAYADGKLVVCDDHTGGIYVLNPETGIVEHSFSAPSERAGGLAYADGTLFIQAGDKIYKVLPEDGTILGFFAVPEKSSRSMAHDGKYLWVSDRIKDEFYMLDPQSGKVLAILAAPGPYPAGIAWLDGFLWNVDFQKRKLYQIVINDKQQPYRLSETRRARVEYLWALNNYGPGEVSDLKVSVALPMALPNQKLLSDISFSTLPAQTTEDKWDQTCALFDLGTVRAGEKAALTYSVNAEISAIRYLIIPDNVGTLEQIPKEIREKYTVDASHYRVSSPYIKETVKKIVGDEKNPYWMARKIYDFVIDSLKYEMTGGWDIPEVVLKRGSGSCSEYTYSFITLCRAMGIPARYQGSIVVRGDDASIDEAFHRWAEIYLPPYGWVPVDANRGDAESPVDQARGIGELSNRFLITTRGGGDSEYLGYSYNSYATYQTKGYCKVEEDNFGFWEPLPSAEPSTTPTGEAPIECKPTTP